MSRAGKVLAIAVILGGIVLLILPLVLGVGLRFSFDYFRARQQGRQTQTVEEVRENVIAESVPTAPPIRKTEAVIKLEQEIDASNEKIFGLLEEYKGE